MNSALVSATLALASAGLMAYAVLLAVRIFRQLPSGALLRWWQLQLGLIAGFAFCYFVFALAIADHEQEPLLGLAAAVFFFNAVFVLLTLKLFRRAFFSTDTSGWLGQSGIFDDSTGIYNLRYFELRLKEEFDRARRYQCPLTMLLIEIDNFKKTYRSYGRNTSEKTLKVICALMKDNARASDILARYGGDQVVMLLPNTALFNAKKAAEKYRAAIEDKVLEVDAAEDDIKPEHLKYTVSIGISSLQNDVKRSSELIRRADIALYKAKDKGRNRVVIYGE